VPKFSKRQQKLRGIGGKHHGPNFIQLPHHVKRSTSYHGLGYIARLLLIELIDRYNGSNNGFIALGVREAAYEIGCSQGSISNALRELDDADLARPTQVGAWRGRHATEWRLTWKVCNKTGQLPRNQWQERNRYHQLLLPKPKREPLTNAERQRRWRNANRNGEFTQESAEVQPGEHRRYASLATRAQNGNSSINVTKPSLATRAHVHIYQREGAAEAETEDDAQPELGRGRE
jgi:hypothetical protein